MKTFSAQEIENIVNGKILYGSANLLITHGVYHTRSIKEQNTLIFLRYTRSIDWAAITQHLPCVIVTSMWLEQFKSVEGCTVILVPDIEVAFWMFVDYYRGLFNIPVVAVTGTCGKTTTKDMIIHMLRQKRIVTGTQLSNNSRTHNFSYLLHIDEVTETAVFETPVGQPGDITNSCKYFKPTIGIITNIGIDHLEHCKTIESYVRAKAEMLSCIKDDGLLIINSDDENIKKLSLGDFPGRIMRFGIYNQSDLMASDVKYSEKGMSFVLKFINNHYDVSVPGYGEHQVYNALAALAAAIETGFCIGDAIEYLKTFTNLPHHNQLRPGINHSLIIDDMWSTNINSLKAALSVLAGLSDGRKRYALIGDINTLGDFTVDIHREVGKMIAETGLVDGLITVGPLSEEIVNNALEYGFKEEAYHFPDVNGVFEFLMQKLDYNSILLIKSAGDKDIAMLNLGYKLMMR